MGIMGDWSFKQNYCSNMYNNNGIWHYSTHAHRGEWKIDKSLALVAVLCTHLARSCYII